MKTKLEVGFKLNRDYNYYKKIMKKHNAINSYTCETHDIYWTNVKSFNGLTENEIKNSCIRLRITRGIGGKDVDLITKIKFFLRIKEKNQYRIENYKGKIIIIKKEEIDKYIKEIEDEEYFKVFDTFKIDYQYRIGNMKSRLQFQDIKDIGLLLYYDNPDIYNLLLLDQRKKLIDEINSYGFDFNYDELGLDKLRTLYYKNEKYSLNQND